MKLIVIILCFVCNAALAQHVADTFQHAEGKNYNMQLLDKQYPPAIGAGDVVFKDASEAELIKAYSTMMRDLCLYLNKNDFRWNAKTRIFNRVYFEPDGSISYYLVNLIPTGMDDKKQEKFLSLLNTFIKTYKINITAKTRFAQCSPVIYEDII